MSAPFQETPPPPSAGVGPDLGGLAADFANALLSQLGSVLQSTFTEWVNNHSPVILLSGFGTLLEGVWTLAGGTLGPSANIFTQLPPAWTYDLAPVVAGRERLQPVAGAVLALGLVLSVLWAGYGTVAGRPFGSLLNSLPRYALAAGGIAFAPRAMAAWIDFVNAASRALLNPASGLPGLDQVRSADHSAAVGALGLMYIVFCAAFLVHRLVLVVLAGLLLIIAPLAAASSALPFSLARRFAWWWLSTFAGITFVSVLQAACLGLGAALVASPTISGAYSGPAQGAMAVALGIGALVAAMQLPRMLLGGLARSRVGTEVAHGAQRLAHTVERRFGLPSPMPGQLPGRATVTALDGSPDVPRLPARSGYVRSLLADR